MKCNKHILVGEFHWDVKSRFLYKTNNDSNTLEKNTITLTPKQHRLLLSLYNAHPKILQRDEIVDFVWESKPTSPESLPQLINRTRIVLKDSNKSILVNEPGVGYSLNFTILNEQEVEGVEQQLIVESTLESKQTHFAELTSLNWKTKCGLPALICLTMLNVGSAIEAGYYSYQFKSAFFSKPYPYAKQMDDNNISIVIDNNECNYTKNTQLLKCQ